ncbi:MAG: GNAT family N-acetyltransferase [Parvularculaceae bacterium]|nr:GNAT family N-acetyltransferase [Parvularculaceae bacterium]
MKGAPNFEIRLADENDAERLAFIGAETFRSTFGHLYAPADIAAFLAESHSPEAYRRTLTTPDFRVWIAEADGGATVGYAVAGPCGLPVPDLTPNSGEVKRIYLDETARGTGLGARLMASALEYLRKRFDRIYLSVYSENFPAQRFYERFGFAKIGEYDFMVGEHADPEWMMELGEPETAQIARPCGWNPAWNAARKARILSPQAAETRTPCPTSARSK